MLVPPKYMITATFLSSTCIPAGLWFNFCEKSFHVPLDSRRRTELGHRVSGACSTGIGINLSNVMRRRAAAAILWASPPRIMPKWTSGGACPSGPFMRLQVGHFSSSPASSTNGGRLDAIETWRESRLLNNLVVCQFLVGTCSFPCLLCLRRVVLQALLQCLF